MVVTVLSFLLFLLPFKSLVSVILTAALSHFILQILSKVLELLSCECKNQCNDRCQCVTNNFKCTDMLIFRYSCRDCNNSITIDESDDETMNDDDDDYYDEEDI